MATPGVALKNFTNSAGESVSTEGLFRFLLSITISVSLNCFDQLLKDYPPESCPSYSRRQRPRTFSTDYSSHYHKTHVALCYADANLSLYVTFLQYHHHHHHQINCKPQLSTFLPLFSSPSPPSKKARTVTAGMFLGRLYKNHIT
jgi:hypothetical protein